MNDNQPGQLITPQGSQDPNPPLEPGIPEPIRQPETPEPVPAPMPPAEPITPQPVYSAPINQSLNSAVPAMPTVEEEQTTDANWQFSAQDPAPTPVNNMGEFAWTAGEFIEHPKGMMWYLTLGVVGLVIAALAYLISHDKITTGTIVAVMIGFGLFATRRPRAQQYRMNFQGILVGAKAYSFHDFKTFSVTEDNTIVSIVFMPLKRFMPPLTIYVAPDMEETVVNFLSGFMPFERHKADAVESLMRRIHF